MTSGRVRESTLKSRSTWMGKRFVIVMMRLVMSGWCGSTNSLLLLLLIDHHLIREVITRLLQAYDLLALLMTGDLDTPRPSNVPFEVVLRHPNCSADAMGR